MDPGNEVADAATAPRRARPNLLFIFSDEHRACSLDGEPWSDARATHLQRLARDGTSFRNCISNYPLCSPYRAMLISGRWPYQTGVVDNGLRLRDEGSSFGEVFRSAGYRTGYIGKWHLSPRPEFISRDAGRHGFEHWEPWFRTRTHLREITFNANTGEQVQREGYSCTLMTDAALDFIDASDPRPWMLALSWVPPHPPFDQAPAAALRAYDPQALQFRPNVPATSKEEVRDYLHGYYAHISALDAELGRLLDRLDRNACAADTIVVYTSDHGSMLGSHGRGGKRLPFDESCRVPFLLRYPGVVPTGRSSDVLLSAIDIFPSLCALAGIGAPAHCEGADLSAAMRGQASKPPDSAFLMHIRKDNAFEGGGGQLAPLFRGVRTERFTYAVAQDGRWCLYDDREDPYQLRNLIGDPSHGRTADGLDGLIFDWLARARDTFPLEAARRCRSLLSDAGRG
jgi:arylsulfatase A-like enzyme